MSARINPNGKGHRLLQCLADGPATFGQIVEALGLTSNTQRKKYAWRLEKLCRERQASWAEGLDGFDAPPEGWAECGDVVFRIVARGQNALAAIGHDWNATPSVRIFSGRDREEPNKPSRRAA